ncbi:GNAT family N-acyltransferase [Telmatobacter sp. DSM 110680]|uniref:GNAT family N-acyltransferase n=1 Tax=Telmatobacter sp. DSM 110680 TaxID=3036704 RepID=A0AAU7DI77_9BACT
MIAQAGQKAPLALLPQTTAPVDSQPTIVFSGLPAIPVKPRIHAEVGGYRLRLAQGADDREAACRLRFRVFNIEMGEGLERSYETGIDTDHFDIFCEHLLVEDKTNHRVIGTYRMQSGITAAMNLGYYSEQEFKFAPYEPLRHDILELGRASIDREHRTPEVLTLLWRGIAQYANEMGLRYLVGCSSLNSKDPAEGWLMYRELERYRVSPEFETVPTSAYVCPTEQQDRETQTASGLQETSMPIPIPTKVPKLLRTYLTIGARICAPPAWDREFGTIDFLTLLDLKMLSAAARNRFLAPLTQ